MSLTFWNKAIQYCRREKGYKGLCKKNTRFHDDVMVVYHRLLQKQQTGGKSNKKCLCCRKSICSCFTRKCVNTKYVYYDVHRHRITDPVIIKRLNAVRMPAKYTDVRFNSKPTDALQGVGMDSRGRWQYRYAKWHTKKAADEKFNRLIRFARELPKIRAKYRLMLTDKNVRTRRTGLALSLLDKCCLRPGSPDYLRENNTHGASTIRSRHVKQKGPSTRVVTFRGKRNKVTSCSVNKRAHPLEYAALGNLMRPGKSLSRPEAMNDALPNDFVVKDFRTYGANVEFIRAACSYPNSHSSTFIKAVAKKLNNTPLVCKYSYIAPVLLQWAKKRPLKHVNKQTCVDAEILFKIILLS